MKKYYKLAAENRKARFDYNILETYKAGIVLTGQEVKSIRQGSVSLQDSFARAEKNEIWAYGVHIKPYQKATTDPIRPRKLLLRSQEQVKLIAKVNEKGLTLVLLKLYFDGNWAKVDLGLAKAKRKFEKREKIRRREAEREIETAFKGKSHDDR